MAEHSPKILEGSPKLRQGLPQLRTKRKPGHCEVDSARFAVINCQYTKLGALFIRQVGTRCGAGTMAYKPPGPGPRAR
jgi:hypothetical protein